MHFGSVLLACATVLATAVAVQAQPINVMSFNVMCSFCSEKDIDPWAERLTYFPTVFKADKPDIVGLQELSFHSEVDAFLKMLPGFKAIFYQSFIKDWPDATIFYNASKFEVLQNGTDWLPRGAREIVPRIMVWAIMRRIIDDLHFVFITTHFDNNHPAQEKSSPFLIERSAAWSKLYPMIITGDFNSKPATEAYKSLVNNMFYNLTESSDVAKNITVKTNLDPPPIFDPKQQIDHIMIYNPAGFNVTEFVFNAEVFGPNKRYPSDHRAIAASISLNKR